jgi:hypothetical protein
MVGKAISGVSIVHTLARVIPRDTEGLLYTATQDYETDAIEHMANCATGLTLLRPSSRNSTQNSLSSQTLGRHVRCPLATRSVLPVTSSLKSSPKRSRSGESNSGVKRPAKQRKKRPRKRRLRRRRRSARRQRRPLVVTRLSRLLRRDKTALQQRPQKRK